MKLNIPKNKFLIKSFFVAVFVGIVIISGIANAAASITVTPSTGLTNGQKVTVTATGLAHNSEGSIEECNSDPNQPTVELVGNATPVSCTSPAGPTIIQTSATGTISATFTVVSGITGPPVPGTDTNHQSSATDAALYPCPPTAAQIAAGYSCQIIYGDASGDQPTQNITFASQTAIATTTTSTTSSSTASNASTSTSSTNTTAASTATTAKKLVDTGPGNIPAIFATIALASGLGYFFYRRNTIS